MGCLALSGKGGVPRGVLKRNMLKTIRIISTGALLASIVGCGQGGNAPTTPQQVKEFRGFRPTAEQMALVRSKGPGGATGAGASSNFNGAQAAGTQGQ